MLLLQELSTLTRLLFREYFRNLFYKKPDDDSVAHVSQAGRQLTGLRGMRLETGT